MLIKKGKEDLEIDWSKNFNFYFVMSFHSFKFWNFMLNFVIVLWKDPFRILGKLLVHPLVCLMNCMISVRHRALRTLKKQRPHGPEPLKEQMPRVISSLLT